MVARMSRPFCITTGGDFTFPGRFFHYVVGIEEEDVYLSSTANQRHAVTGHDVSEADI